MSIKCTVCSSENLQGALFCEFCGSRLPQSNGDSPPSPKPQESLGEQPAPPTTPAPSLETSSTPVTKAETVTVEAEAPLEHQKSKPPTQEPSRESLAEPTQEYYPSTSLNCVTCGASNPPGSKFCEDCGASLSGQASNPSVEIPETPLQVAEAKYHPSGNHPAVHPKAERYSPATGDLSHSNSGSPALRVTTTGQLIPINQASNLVGRRSPVDGIYPEIDLTDTDSNSYISRRHARISSTQSGLELEDLGSANGTFVNGVRLNPGEKIQLKDGDRIQFGKLILNLEERG